jgi:serine/threonine protein kinase
LEEVNFEVKIADLGLAKIIVNENDFAETCCGSPLYMAPEVI